MGILDRIAWLLWRRPQLKRSGSAAHWTSFVCPGSHLDGYNKIGKGSLISKSRLGRFSYVASAKICRTDMGSFCSVGPGVIIGGLGAHPLNWLSTHPAFYSTKMQAGHTFSVTDKFTEERSNKIGSDVWIGANALILDGVQVGDGAIIAAGAVVAKDVPPFAVVGGVPSKVIRFRFDEDVIEQLLSWKWWDLPEKEIAAISQDFSCRNQWTSDDVLFVQEQLKASKAPQ